MERSISSYPDRKASIAPPFQLRDCGNPRNYYYPRELIIKVQPCLFPLLARFAAISDNIANRQFPVYYAISSNHHVLHYNLYYNGALPCGSFFDADEGIKALVLFADGGASLSYSVHFLQSIKNTRATWAPIFQLVIIQAHKRPP